MFLQQSSEVHGWIETLWKITRAVDVLAVVPSETPQYFTWFPYQSEECSNVKTIVQINSSNLFPQKLTPPYNNCPLVAATTLLSPFVVDEERGSETQMFLDLAQKLGMMPVYFHLPNGLNVWTVFDTSYRPYSGLKLLFENELDVMFSEMSMAFSTSTFAEFLFPHNVEEYIFFVPGSIEAPRTTAILKAFAPRAWTYVIIASVLIYVSVAAIPFLETSQIFPAFVPTIALILNVPSNFPPSKALKIFAVIAYIYSMHITTAYTTSFIVFLSDVPREKPMQSLEEIVESGLMVQMHIAFQNVIASLSSSLLMNTINQPDRMMHVTVLNLSFVAERKSIVIGPKISYVSQLRQDKYYDEFDYPKIHVIQDTIFYSFLTFYVSKGHPLFEQLNTNFIRLIEGGFPEHYNFLVLKPDRPKLRKLEPFGVKNVEGPFILLLSCLGVCFLAWVCEWAFFWLKNLLNKKEPMSSRSSRSIKQFSWVFNFLTRQRKGEQQRM